LGIVVVGGLVFAGILTLYVIPSIYSYLSRPHKMRKDDGNTAIEKEALLHTH
jgi:multidrug efflux pump